MNMNNKTKYYLICFSSLFLTILLLPIMSTIGSDVYRVFSSLFSWFRGVIFIIYFLFAIPAALIGYLMEQIYPNWSYLIPPHIIFSLYLLFRSLNWERRIDKKAILMTAIFLSALTSSNHTYYEFRKNHYIDDPIGRMAKNTDSIERILYVGEAIFLSIVIVELINFAIHRANKNKPKSP